MPLLYKNANTFCIELHAFDILFLGVGRIYTRLKFPIYTKVWEKAKIRNLYNQVPHLTQDIIWEKDKSTRTIPYKRANMLTLSQQVTTRLQLKYITEGNDKHKNHHLGTVSKKITGELKLISRCQPSHLFWWFETHSCLVCMSYP